jgi:hypothetical protein
VPGLLARLERQCPAVDERDARPTALTVAAAIAVVSGGAGQPTDEVVSIGERRHGAPPRAEEDLLEGVGVDFARPHSEEHVLFLVGSLKNKPANGNL